MFVFEELGEGNIFYSINFSANLMMLDNAAFLYQFFWWRDI